MKKCEGRCSEENDQNSDEYDKKKHEKRNETKKIMCECGSDVKDNENGEIWQCKLCGCAFMTKNDTKNNKNGEIQWRRWLREVVGVLYFSLNLSNYFI